MKGATWNSRGGLASTSPRRIYRHCQRWILVFLALGVAFTSISVLVFASESSAQDPVTNRIECSDANDDFVLLCLAFEAITENFVDAVAVADLAEAAKQGVIDADLADRTTDAPPCALPAPEFEDMCAEIDKAEDTTAAALAATDAMLASLNEARTRRLTPEQHRSFDDSLDSDITRAGIGIEYALLDTDGNPCTTPSDRCRMIILEVYSGSPAETAGLKAGDVLIEYGKVVSDHSCSNLLNLDNGHDLDEPVSVSIIRDGAVQELDLVTAEVSDPAVFSQVVDGNVGYIQLDAFAQESPAVFLEHLTRLVNSGVNAIVVDLRNNPGGYLTETGLIAALFLEQNDVVYRIVSVHGIQTGSADSDGIASDAVALPMAVAVNHRSASGSELFVLAMRGNNRAKIVGTTTYGKNTGQVTLAAESSDGTLLGAIQVTSLRFFGPGDISSQGGIQPDTVTSISDCSHPIGVVRRAVTSLYPRVSGLAITSNPTAVPYASGDKVTVAVTFDAPVIVDTTNGVPYLDLQIGTEIRQAAYKSISTVGGISVVEFEYTVGSDNDDDGISIEANSISLNGATIRRSGSGWDVVLDHPLLAADLQHAVSTEPVITEPVITEPVEPEPEADRVFRDISHTPFVEHINWLAEQGITKGCGPDTFCPDQTVTRGQMAAFLSRALQLPAADQDYFTDDNGSTFEDDINRLRQAGITTGCGPDTFCGDQPVTRDQMAAFLSRALQLPAADQDYFTDDNGSTFEDDINRLRQAEITKGKGGAGMFSPDQPVTRGEMAAFLSRARDLIAATRQQTA